MNEDANETGLERRAKRAFDESVAALDGQTRSRLARARIRALEAGPGRSWLTVNRLLPAGALAAAALAAAVLLNGPLTTEPDMELVATGDLDILLGEEDLELLEELEFYSWLEEQPELIELADDPDGTG